MHLAADVARFLVAKTPEIMVVNPPYLCPEKKYWGKENAALPAPSHFCFLPAWSSLLGVDDGGHLVDNDGDNYGHDDGDDCGHLQQQLPALLQLLARVVI